MRPQQDLIVSVRRTGTAAGHDSGPRARIVGRAQRSESRSTARWVRKSGHGSGSESGPDGVWKQRHGGGKDYLLTPMRKKELAVLDEVLDRVAEAVETVIVSGVSAAMNECNGPAGEWLHRRPSD